MVGLGPEFLAVVADIAENFSERLFERGLCLPSGSSMSDADLERVIGILRQTLG